MYDLVFLAHARLNYSQFTEEMDFYAYLIPESANKGRCLLRCVPKQIDFLNYWRQVEACFDDSFNFVVRLEFPIKNEIVATLSAGILRFWEFPLATALNYLFPMAVYDFDS